MTNQVCFTTLEFDQPWTLENYLAVFDPVYLGLFWRSLWIACVATVIALVMGLPVALAVRTICGASAESAATKLRPRRRGTPRASKRSPAT